MSPSSFIVFYCVIISLDTTFGPWIERLNPKSLVCKTQPTTVGPKDLVHNPLKQTRKPKQKSILIIPGTHFVTIGYQKKAGESHLHLFQGEKRNKYKLIYVRGHIALLYATHCFVKR